MLDIVEEQKNLIEKLVKSNTKFAGNEDLFDDFCNEVYKRSCHVLKGVKEVNSIEGYLRKVTQTSILCVLKDLGRVRRLSSGYSSIQREIPMSALNLEDTQEIEQKILSNNFDYNIQNHSLSVEDLLITKDLINSIVNIIFQYNVQCPDKKYLDIFTLRYKYHKKQSEIAQELGLSQSEVSKRLVEISKLVKQCIEN